ncbi:hypothetical protein IJ847_01530 [Candidatus Saccharibacteria bacterium]|nr:hypothetical protein [Candidatus Saccharibacteria bacterium]
MKRVVATKKEMCSAIDKVAKIIGHRPTMSEYRKHCTEDMPDADTIRRHFGGWLGAVEAAGYNPARSRKLAHRTDVELILDLTKVARLLGYTPDQNSYDAHREPGMASSVTYARRFGSWPKALERAKLKYEERTFTKEEIIDAIVCVEQILGRAFTQKEYNELRSPDMPCTGTIKSHLGGWKAAMKEAGHERLKNFARFTDDEITAVLQDIAETLGHTPNVIEYVANRPENAPHWSASISSRFGSWENAVKAAGLPPVNHAIYTNEEMLEKLKAVAERAGGKLSESIYLANRVKGEPSIALLQKRFGSWRKALELAGLL